MLHTLLGTFRWLWVLLFLFGLVGAYFFWEERERLALVDREGVEAVARLINIRQQTSSGQNRRTSYWADVRWREHTGTERLRERIPVSGTFARRVLQDGRLVQFETRIKYLPGAPDVRPLLLEDGAHNGVQTPFMMWFCLALAALSAFFWVHMLRYERRNPRKATAAAA